MTNARCRELLAEIRLACEFCRKRLRWRDGKPNLDFAHMGATPLSGAGRGRGLKRRYYDIKAHPECYKLACKACHARNDFRAIVGMPPLPTQAAAA